jgi:hypothetical protein
VPVPFSVWTKAPFVGRFGGSRPGDRMAIFFADERFYRAFVIAISTIKAEGHFVLFRINLPGFAV